MLQIADHGLVTELRMATSFFGRGMVWASAFHVDGVLVDAGPPRTAPALAEWLRNHPLKIAVNTHAHEDHVGGDYLLPVTPLAPAASLERLAHPPRIQPFRHLAWGRARPVAAQPLGPSVEAGSLHFEVLPTPGHSDDHVVFVEPEHGWAFTGDLFVSDRIHYAQADEDVLEAMGSMRRALEADFEEIYCGHAGRVPDGKNALRRKIQFLEDVRGRALRLREQGLDEAAIARQVFGRLGNWHWITGGWFSEVNLIHQLLGDGDAG